MQNSQDIKIETYTSKSFVLRGNTRPHKETIKYMGGKWNARLTDKKTQEKFGAWLFWADKKTEIQQWILRGCPPNTQGGDKYLVDNGYSGGSESHRRNQIDKLIEKVKRLEIKIEELSRIINKSPDGPQESEESEEPNSPAPPMPRRLLR